MMILTAGLRRLRSIYLLNVNHLFYVLFQTATLRREGVEPDSVTLGYELTAAMIDPVNITIKTARVDFFLS